MAFVGYSPDVFDVHECGIDHEVLVLGQQPHDLADRLPVCQNEELLGASVVKTLVVPGIGGAVLIGMYQHRHIQGHRQLYSLCSKKSVFCPFGVRSGMDLYALPCDRGREHLRKVTAREHLRCQPKDRMKLVSCQVLQFEHFVNDQIV